ncbi:DUF4276 family protein [Sphingobacterium multivorum]|uniref:DUF4276 family protein n=1 Tax=Sphingobacterium multivorum TaxID=28454 RepID=UPI0028A86F64|nr:DUF4276 family protein [Sphingobacterium multivorum]
MAQLFFGLIAEGTTDFRFFERIIEKALIDIAYECRGEIDIDIKIIECKKGNSFIEFVLNGAAVGLNRYGINMLIVHSDADDSTATNTYTQKITPAIETLNTKSADTHCKNLIAIVPVHETESWMLADKEIFIKAIGTKKTEAELNINGNPETFNNPKERIIEAIRIGRAEMPKKMRDALQISDLYSYLGQAIQLEKLKTFASYLDFERNIRSEFIKLNLLPQ